MDKATFEIANPILEKIAKVAFGLLESAEMEKLRSLLTKLDKAIGSRYTVELDLTVDVFDVEKERCLPLLQTGLAGFDQEKPYLAHGDRTEEKYIADGEIVVVPHNRCPLCWEEWDSKFSDPTCSECGAQLGTNVMVLLDTDLCPNCEDGEVSMSQLTCPKCGDTVDPRYVAWG